MSSFWSLVSGQTKTTGDAGDVIGISETRWNSLVRDGGRERFVKSTNMVEGSFLLWCGVVHWGRSVVVVEWSVIAVTTGYAGKMMAKFASTDLTIRGSLFVGHV